MSGASEITDLLNETWERLRVRWTGEAPDVFYQQYVARMRETVGDFESGCEKLSAGAEDLMKKLDFIEYSI